MILIVALLAGAVAYLCFRLYRQKSDHRSHVAAVVQSNVTARDLEMAPFHIRRFTDAIEQCERPELRHEYERNLAYWTHVQAANEARP